MIKKLLFLVTIPCLGCILASEHQENTTLAVTYFFDRSIQPNPDRSFATEGIFEMLTADLSNSSQLQVIGGEKIQELYRNLGELLGGLVDKTRAYKIGQMAKAQKVLWGSFREKGQMLEIEAYLVDVATDDSIYVGSVKGSDFFKLEKKLALKITGTLSVKLTSEELKNINTVPNARLSFADRLSELHDYSHAIKQYEILLNSRAFCERLNKNLLLTKLIMAKENKKTWERLLREKNLLDNINAPEQLARARYQIGRKYRDLTMYNEAISEFNQVMELAPQSEYVTKAFWHLEVCYRALGKSELALKMAWKMVEREPDARYADEMLLEIANYYENEGNDLRKAKETYEMILKKYPLSNSVDDALDKLSEFYLNMGPGDTIGNEMPSDLDSQMTTIPYDEVYLSWFEEKKADIYKLKGRANLAREEYLKCIGRHPDAVIMPRLYASLATIDSSFDYYQKAIALVKKQGFKNRCRRMLGDPRYFRLLWDVYCYPSYYHMVMGDECQRRGQYTDAIKHYRDAIKNYKTTDFSEWGTYNFHFNGYYHSQIAKMYEIIKKSDSAIIEYRNAVIAAKNKDKSVYSIPGIRIFGEDNPADYQTAIGDIYSLQGNYRAAIEEYDTATRLYGGGIEVLEKIRHCYNLLDSNEKEINVYKRILKRYPYSTPEKYLEAIGDIYINKLNNPGKALEFYNAIALYTPSAASAVKPKINTCRAKLKWSVVEMFRRIKPYQLILPSTLQKTEQNKIKKRNRAQDTLEQVPAPEDMVYVPAGICIIGSGDGDDDERPATQVWVHAFFIDKYEVTNQEYERFVKATGSYAPTTWNKGKIPPGMENHPVANVSFELARAYAKWASKRLPTETEWEKAARGSKGFVYPWGNEFIPKAANLNTDSTSIVGSFPQDKSPYGCFDMAGNLTEWTCSKWMASGNTLITKGGNWYDNCLPYYSRASYRNYQNGAGDISIGVGFRCVKGVEKKK
jgi:formylglycine-generating enzyme required for sulfatase activity/lipopolysaccharide biosynthesis regulator YciM/TolB-like protein